MNSTRRPCVEDLPHWFVGIPHFITGSVRFGCASDNSDLDVCIPIQCAWRDRLPLDIKCEPSNYNNGVKFMHCGIVINVVQLHPRVYVAWHKAAKMACAIDAFKSVDRNHRYAMHAMLCSIADLSVTTAITTTNFMDFIKDERCD